MFRVSRDIYRPTASHISDFDGEEGDGVGFLGADMEEDSLGETDTDEFVHVVGQNGSEEEK